VHFTASGDLKIGAVSTVNPAVTIDGVSTSDADVKLTVGGNLTFEEAVVLGAGDLFLDVLGDVRVSRFSMKPTTLMSLLP